MSIIMRIYVPCFLAILVGAGVLAPRALAQCEVQKLTASDPGCKNYYGRAVAIDGTTALVGAWGHAEPVPNAGAAYVYELGPSGWVETAELLAGDPDLGDVFGEAVAISGDTALVTAPGDDEAASLAGAAYIFERTAGVWVQTQKLFASDAGSGAYWGNAASMSGDRAIIGNRLAHAAYVFERSGGFWVEVAKLTASDRGSDWFGVSVSISEDGETVIVGAYYDDDACVNDPNCNSGSAYIFERTPVGWVETAKLTASDGAKGDIFGFSVAVSGDKVVVGSPGDKTGLLFLGSAYVFERSPGGTWGPHATVKLEASDAESGDSFGMAVDIFGDVLVVGAHNDDDVGSAYLFRRRPSGWLERGKFMAGDRSLSDLFGCPVAICGETVIIGAWGDDDASPLDVGCNSGSAYVFTIGDHLGQNYCGPAVPNSSGDPAEIHACGSTKVADSDLVLRASHMAKNKFGYFLTSQTQGFIPNPAGSQGNLCLANPIGRFAKDVQLTGPSGTFSTFVDLSDMPGGQSSVLAGETWNFQCWFRDKVGGPTSNFTDGVAVLFQ